MLVTAKGQVTIPAWIRDRQGFLPHTEVEFEIDGDAIRIVKSDRGGRRGKALLGALKGSAQSRLSTDEIMALTRG